MDAGGYFSWLRSLQKAGYPAPDVPLVPISLDANAVSVGPDHDGELAIFVTSGPDQEPAPAGSDDLRVDYANDATFYGLRSLWDDPGTIEGHV